MKGSKDIQYYLEDLGFILVPWGLAILALSASFCFISVGIAAFRYNGGKGDAQRRDVETVTERERDTQTIPDEFPDSTASRGNGMLIIGGELVVNPVHVAGEFADKGEHIITYPADSPFNFLNRNAPSMLLDNAQNAQHLPVEL